MLLARRFGAMGLGWLAAGSLGSCFFHLARTQATGADPDTPGPRLKPGPDSLQIRLPATLGNVVRVTDIGADRTDFTADFAMSSQLSS